MPKTVCVLVCLLSSTLLYAAPKSRKGSIAAARLPALSPDPRAVHRFAQEGRRLRRELPLRVGNAAAGAIISLVAPHPVTAHAR